MDKFGQLINAIGITHRFSKKTARPDIKKLGMKAKLFDVCLWDIHPGTYTKHVMIADGDIEKRMSWGKWIFLEIQ